MQARVTRDDLEPEHSSQLFSSQSEGETTDEDGPNRRKGNREDALPRVIDALCLNYIGLLLLRIPVTVANLSHWVSNGGLTYYRAVNSLDFTMRCRLAGRYNNSLDPQQVLRTEVLHTTILDTITMYHRGFGMVVPPINYHLCLYRAIRDLRLPLEVYAATIRLSRMLNISFTYNVDARSSARYQVLRLADAQLIGLVVLATKLLFPFDDRERYPRRPTELAALRMNWGAWSKARAEAARPSDLLTYGDALQTTENDVFDMSDEKLDQYMDWYQTAFAEENIRDTGRASREAGFRRALFRLFPVDRPSKQNDEDEDMTDHVDEATQDMLLGRVQGSLRPLRVIAENPADETAEDINRPGTYYKRFRIPQELVGHSRDFYDEVAYQTGLSLDSLVQAVFGLEKRLEEWEIKARQDQT